jgi:hypothetical protein
VIDAIVINAIVISAIVINAIVISAIVISAIVISAIVINAIDFGFCMFRPMKFMVLCVPQILPSAKIRPMPPIAPTQPQKLVQII